MPFPNTRVLPVGWSAHHRPVVAQTFTATVEIRHPGGTEGAFDPVTGTKSVVPFAPHHSGGARIQIRPIFHGEEVSGDQELTGYGYLVVVDLAGSVDTEVNDLVDVTAVDDNGDPSMVGRTITVTGVGRGSLAWERDLVCSDDLG